MTDYSKPPPSPLNARASEGLWLLVNQYRKVAAEWERAWRKNPQNKECYEKWRSWEYAANLLADRIDQIMRGLDFAS